MLTLPVICKKTRSKIKHGTSWNNNVRISSQWLDMMIIGWLNELVVLLDDAVEVTTALTDVALESTSQPDV